MASNGVVGRMKLIIRVGGLSRNMMKGPNPQECLLAKGRGEERVRCGERDQRTLLKLHLLTLAEYDPFPCVPSNDGVRQICDDPP